MTGMPENILSVLTEENKIREKSITEVENSTELQEHVQVIDCAINILGGFSIEWNNHNDDEKILVNRSLRLMKDFTAAVNLLLAGYYHVVSMLIRSIEESNYLLCFFHEDRPRIQQWQEASLEELRSMSFRGSVKRLYDNEVERNAIDVYNQFLCEFGTHPSPKDYRLFVKDGKKQMELFFHLELLEAYLATLAQYAIIAVLEFTSVFGADTPKGYPTSIFEDFSDRTNEWLNKYGSRVEQEDLDDIKRILRRTRRGRPSGRPEQR